MNGNKWSADYPDLNCIWQGAQMAQKQDLAAIGEHGAATLGCPSCQGGDNAHQPPVNIALTIAYTNPGAHSESCIHLWIECRVMLTCLVHPVVIAGIPTEHGGDPSVVRIQNLRKYGERPTHGLNAGGINYGNYAPPDGCPASGSVAADGTCNAPWCFEMFLQEPECLDAWHMTEAVDWMVFEEGAYYTKEGAMMQTGTKAVQGGGWETAHFHQAFPETTAASGVAVMSQLQTTNVR